MIGQTISHYRILSKLGEGGMGVVYKAEDVKLKRSVALKFLPSHATENRERFLREAQAAASLNHPNICTIHEIDEEHGFIAMEVIEGPSVKDKIEVRPLPLEEALHIAMQACTGLQAAHDKGIVHRDIKPANLMVTAQGQVKIMDFGLAQTGDRTRLTKTGASIGTPAYMSPEQAQRQATDRRSDIWSLGVALYEMVSGKLPFEGEREAAVVHAIIHEQHEPLTAIRAGVPLELDRIVAKALAKSPEDRYQHAADLIVDLRGAAIPRQSPTRQPPTRQPTLLARKRFPWAYLLAAALILAVSGFFTWRALVPQQSIDSIVILPLRQLSQDATDSFLGLGIADALITKISQTGQLQVRPTSAVRRYATEDSDPLEAARHLNAEAVLAGSLQQSGDRIRVSVQLLKTTTGETIWAESFDVHSGDVFTVQDEIARQVAGQLSLKLDAGQRRDFEKRSTANPEAFEFYSKGLYHLGNRALRGGGEVPLAIEVLKKAVELDPNYALARALLGYAYAVRGVFTSDDPAIIDLATKQLTEAETLDPRIAQIHVARSVLLYSRYGHWDLRGAILEARAAQRLDPNAGHNDLAYYYWHVGLEALAVKHKNAALLADPDNEYYKAGLVGFYYASLLANEGAAAEQKLYRRSPSVEFYLIKEMVNEAAPLVEKENAVIPVSSLPRATNLMPRVHRARLYALQEKFAAAATEIAAVEIEAEKAPRTQPFHHTSYGIAQVRARLGDAPRALRWLQITVDAGWPQYPMMARDPMLDRVRNDPAVAQFLASLKKTWENNQREFGDEEQ
jgi:serine/threonine protein kinase